MGKIEEGSMDRQTVNSRLNSAKDKKDSSQHAKGQMGIESYFKSPQRSSSKPVDRRKDMLDYFKKVPRTPEIKPQVEKQPKDNTALADEIIVILPENSFNGNILADGSKKDPLKSVKKTNGVWNNSYKRSDEKIGRNSVVDLEMSECNKSDVVDVCKDFTSNQGIYISEVSNSKVWDKNVDKSVMKFENSCVDNEKSAASTDNDLLNSDAAKKKNIFAFMMANRGKQNDVLKEMEANEHCNKDNTLSVGKISNQIVYEKQDSIMITDEILNEYDIFDKTDPSKGDGALGNKSIVTDDVKALSSSVISDNVFVFMMANRHRQKNLLSKSGNSEEIPDHVPQAQSENLEKGKCSGLAIDTSTKGRETSGIRKQKDDDLDSSLQDFELTPKIDIRKKRKCPNKKFGNQFMEEIVETNHTFGTGFVNPASPSNTPVSTLVEEVKFSNSISFVDFIKAAAATADKRGEEESKEDGNGDLKDCLDAQQKINESLKSHSIDNTVVKGTDFNNTSMDENDVSEDGFDFHKTDNKGSINNTIKYDENIVSRDDSNFHKTDIKGIESIDSEIKGERKVKNRNSLTLKKNTCVNGRSSIKEDGIIDNKNISQTGKKQIPGAPLKKRSRKKVKCVIESDDDSLIPEAAAAYEKESGCITTSVKGIDSPSQQESLDCSKISGISKFFKKISQDEKTVERSKNVFTVKADVHAPQDGVKAIVCSKGKVVKSMVNKMSLLDAATSCKEDISDNSCEKRSSRRSSKRIRKNQELEDLNKIEVLEQIALTSSPKKDTVNSIKRTSIIRDNEIQQKHKIMGNLEELKLCSDTTKSEELTLSASKQKKIENEPKVSSRRALRRMSRCQNSDGEKIIKEKKIGKLDASCSGEAELLSKKGTLEENPRIHISKEMQVPKILEIKGSNTTEEPLAVRRSLRRKRHVSVELEEKSPEIIKNSETNKIRTSDCSVPVEESSFDISHDSSPEKVGTERVDCSANFNEDEEESTVMYTSTLIHRSRKLQLRIKRVHHPSRCKEKGSSLSLQKSNVMENQIKQKKAKKVLQKAKEIKGSNKVKRLSYDQKKKKACLDDVTGPLTKETAMQVIEHDVVIIDDLPSVKDGQRDSAEKTKRRRSSQLLLKPLPLDSSAGKQMQNKKKKVNCMGKMKMKISEASEIGNARGRRSSRQAAVNAKKAIEEQRNNLQVEEVEKKTNKESKKEMFSKDVKLAPIFCKKSKLPPCVEVVKVVTLSPTKLKARQDFLHSGVPDEIKKQVSAERSSNEEELCDWPPFPEVSHIQQRNENEALWNLGNPDIPLLKMNCEHLSLNASKGKHIFHQNILSLPDNSNHNLEMSQAHTPVLDMNTLASLLVYMKKMNPYFPVYAVFKSYLDMKKEAVESFKKELEKEEEKVIDLEDDNNDDMNGKRTSKRKSKALSVSKNKRLKLGGIKNKTEDRVQKQPAVPFWQEKTPHTWTQVYAPRSSNQVIGNAEHLKRLKIWLQEWKGKREVYANKKHKKKVSKRGGDFITDDSSGWEEDDFSVSDESDGWDEEDSVKTYLLCGPPGVGKTTTVYALAAELGYKVLEISASSRRPGRQVMSQLAEATQSHSLSNTSSQPTSTVTAMFAAKTSCSANAIKKSKHSTLGEDSQGSGKDSEKKNRVSLVLFEDIDIVFEEWDEGFISAVNSFMASTKRPIILTVSHPSPSVLSRIKGNYEKIDFVPPAEDLTAQHLQLVCLANGHHICYKDVESLVHINKGDVRQSLLDLQLLALSGSSTDECNCGRHEAVNMTSKEYGSTAYISRTKDLRLIDIFPEAINTKTQDIQIYRAGLWGKLQGSAAFEVKISNLKSDRKQPWSDHVEKVKGRVPWTQMANNFSFILPFPLKKKEQKPQRYPLQSTDIFLKTTCLWQRYSWLSLDDEDEKDNQQPEIAEEKEDTREKIEVPQSVENVVKPCLKSMANLYETFAQLDILDASQWLINPSAQIKDQGWWAQQPTAGLNDDLGNPHPYWSPVDNISDISNELGHRALIQCSGEIISSLEELPSKDWPQLCMADDSRQGIPNLLPHFSSRDSERSCHRKIMASIASRLPLVNQLGRNIAMDYLPIVRSLIRYDELGAAVSKHRRGRRFLSQLAQLGFDISLEDKLKMANALIT